MSRRASTVAQSLVRQSSQRFRHSSSTEVDAITFESLRGELKSKGNNLEVPVVAVCGSDGLTTIDSLRPSTHAVTTTPSSNSQNGFENDQPQGFDLDRQDSESSSKVDSEPHSTDLLDNPFDHTYDNVSSSLVSRPSDIRAAAAANCNADQAVVQTFDQASERNLPIARDQKVEQSVGQALDDSQGSSLEATLSHDSDHISNNTSFRTICFHNDIFPIENQILSPAEEALKSKFQITSHATSSLTALPDPVAHAGTFDYIGKENDGRPKWLWDSQTDRTVETTDERLQEGYVAISYTWGRFRDDSKLYNEPGTPWSLPKMKQCGFEMRQLKKVMREIPSARYFWVDVLCINQQRGEERSTEIAKQGSIFKHANGTFVYLWTIETAEHLARAMTELGELLLMATGDPERLSVHKQYADEYGRKLRADYWFSSLWTLQEMVLAPAATWITRDGTYCNLNGGPLTTHTVASVLRVLRQSRDFSPFSPPGPGTDPIDNAVQKWLIWGLKEASLHTCVSTSRLNILLAGTQRQATDPCRGVAILAALKVGFESKFAVDSAGTGGMPVALLNALMENEDTALFDCEHSLQPPNGKALTGLLPTTADLIGEFPTKALSCKGWYYRDSGELVIPRGTRMHTISSWSEGLSFKLQDIHMSLPNDGLDAKQEIRNYLYKTNGLSIGQVKFLPTGMLDKEPSVHRGIILVTQKNYANEGKDLRWHKAGIYYTSKAVEYMSEQPVVIRPDIDEKRRYPSSLAWMTLLVPAAVAFTMQVFGPG